MITDIDPLIIAHWFPSLGGSGNGDDEDDTFPSFGDVDNSVS
jgi:hypothetical protein